MDQHKIFSATLGLHRPWEIQKISISEEEKRMDIAISVTNSSITCPTCGKSVELCDETSEMWHHDNFFRYAAYLHVRVPVVKCACCGVCMIERPWSRLGSKFVQVAKDESVQVDSACNS